MKRAINAAGPLKDLYRQTACIGPELAAGIYSAASTDLGLQMENSLIGNRPMEIVSASINPRAYSSADTFMRDYLCVELMSKYPSWDLGIDRPGVALSKFRSVEEDLCHLNLSQNQRIVAGLRSTTMHPLLQRHVLKSRRCWASLVGMTWNPSSHGGQEPRHLCRGVRAMPPTSLGLRSPKCRITPYLSQTLCGVCIRCGILTPRWLRGHA